MTQEKRQRSPAEFLKKDEDDSFWQLHAGSSMI